MKKLFILLFFILWPSQVNAIDWGYNVRVLNTPSWWSNSSNVTESWFNIESSKNLMSCSDFFSQKPSSTKRQLVDIYSSPTEEFIKIILNWTIDTINKNDHILVDDNTLWLLVSFWTWYSDWDLIVLSAQKLSWSISYDFTLKRDPTSCINQKNVQYLDSDLEEMGLIAKKLSWSTVFNFKLKRNSTVSIDLLSWHYDITPLWDWTLKITVDSTFKKITFDWEIKINMKLSSFWDTKESKQSYSWELAWSTLNIDTSRWIIVLDWVQQIIRSIDLSKTIWPIDKDTRITLLDSSLPFIDISDSFAKQDIVNLYNEGKIRETWTRMYHPNINITRAEFLEIAMVTFNNDIKYLDSEFIDTTWLSSRVASSAKRLWYIDWQNWKFRPDDAISRAEAMKIIMKIAWEDISWYNRSSFSDVKESWAVWAIERWRELWIINWQKWNFRPNDWITRAESAKIIANTATYEKNVRSMLNTNIPSQDINLWDLYKPVIYVYPLKDTLVSIKEQITNWKFTFTYPEYWTGWSVLAKRNWDLLDTKSWLHIPYLFWEGEQKVDYSIDKGFVIDKKSVTKFLEEKLTLLWLNSREKADFITFWAPRMMWYKSVKVKFIVWQDYDKKIAKSDITPKPDSIQRVFMLFSEAKNWERLKEQTLEKFERTWYSVIEWGWTELK